MKQVKPTEKQEEFIDYSRIVLEAPTLIKDRDMINFCNRKGCNHSKKNHLPGCDVMKEVPFGKHTHVSTQMRIKKYFIHCKCNKFKKLKRKTRRNH